MHKDPRVQDQASKERILHALLSGEEVSGQSLADAAGISRTAVWKHISGLRGLGFSIQAGPGKGYRLLQTPDSLHPIVVRPGLTTQTLGQTLEYREEVDSTQRVLRELARDGAAEGSVVLAERQMQGKGRRERGWESLPGGVAVSVLFTPRLAPDRISQFLLLAGVAAAEAVNEQTEIRAGLKWPNDVLLQGKKIGGILAEMASDAERIEHLILGVGLNLNTAEKDIPAGIRDSATSVRAACGGPVSRPQVVRDLLARLEHYYFRLLQSDFSPVRQEWLRHNVTLGRRVRADTDNTVFEGLAADIDHTGALLLQDDAGAVHRLLAADISLRTRGQRTEDG